MRLEVPSRNVAKGQHVVAPFLWNFDLFFIFNINIVLLDHLKIKTLEK
jgi:hypothetical protein